MVKAYPQSKQEISKPLRSHALFWRCLPNLFVFIDRVGSVICICKTFLRDWHLYQKSLQTIWHAFLHVHKSRSWGLSSFVIFFVFLLLHSLSHLQNKHTKYRHFSEWRAEVVTVLRCVVLFLTDSFVSSDSQGCYSSVSDDVDCLLVLTLRVHLEQKMLACDFTNNQACLMPHCYYAE